MQNIVCICVTFTISQKRSLIGGLFLPYSSFSVEEKEGISILLLSRIECGETSPISHFLRNLAHSSPEQLFWLGGLSAHVSSLLGVSLVGLYQLQRQGQLRRWAMNTLAQVPVLIRALCLG